jgi:hypothetical protein
MRFTLFLTPPNPHGSPRTPRPTPRTNRLESARKKQQAAKTLSNQQQFAGAVIGFNAESGTALIALDNGGTVSCEVLTSRYLKPGQRVITTIPQGTNQGFVDGLA